MLKKAQDFHSLIFPCGLIQGCPPVAKRLVAVALFSRVRDSFLNTSAGAGAYRDFPGVLY